MWSPWIAGSVALAAFANVYSEVQRCQTDVRSARDRFALAALEERQRLCKFVRAAAEAKDIVELKVVIDKSRISKAFVYSKFNGARTEEVGMEWSRSLRELMRYENAAMLNYMETYSHNPVLLITKQILYGAD